MRKKTDEEEEFQNLVYIILSILFIVGIGVPVIYQFFLRIK